MKYVIIPQLWTTAVILSIGIDGRYMYTSDLLALNTANLPHASNTAADPHTARVSTPLDLQAWQTCPSMHPDQDFAAYILNGLQHGFHIGIHHSAQLQSAKRSMKSASDNPQVIEDYLHKELAAHNILGPFSPSTFPGLHINRFGVIPKKHQPESGV